MAITVNGKQIFTDKQLVSIVNSRITFSDGSWCDVDTGKVVNNGPGYIQIGGDSLDDSDHITIAPRAYHTRNLDIRDLTAKVVVEVHGRVDTIVSMKGPRKKLDAVTFTVDGETLKVRGKGPTLGSFGNVSIGNIFVSGSISGGTTVIGGSSDSDTTITIQVPRGAALMLANTTGPVTIGSTHGPLDLDLGNVGDVTVGEVTDTTLDLSGTCDVSIAKVTGNLTVDLSGVGGVDVEEGDVSFLRVRVSGTSNFNFGGTAQNADLGVSGVGDIKVRHVVAEPRKRVSGVGTIKVRTVG